jgi:hypothetical protein
MTKPCYGQRERHGRSPNSLEAFSILAASSALAGQTDKAHKALARLLQENPRRRLSDERFRESAIQRAEDHARLVAGLRKAEMHEARCRKLTSPTGHAFAGCDGRDVPGLRLMLAAARLLLALPFLSALLDPNGLKDFSSADQPTNVRPLLHNLACLVHAAFRQVIAPRVEVYFNLKSFGEAIFHFAVAPKWQLIESAVAQLGESRALIVEFRIDQFHLACHVQLDKRQVVVASNAADRG